jgi:hypothetical protein
MTVYRKTMADAYREMYSLNEDNMDLMRKAAKGAMQTIKFKDGKLKMDSFTASGIMAVYDKINPKNKESMEKMINHGNKSQIMRLQSLAMKNVKGRKEEVEIDEAKSSTGYELYHKTFSGAMQHAYAHAKKKFGITVNPNEIDDKVATGPAKPSKGKTNKYGLKGDKGGIQVQVYNSGKNFELNMYKEEVVKEGTWQLPQGNQAIKGLKRLLTKPIELGKMAQNAKNTIDKYLGDDELFDDLEDAADKNPKGDARPIIKKAMKRLNISEDITPAMSIYQNAISKLVEKARQLKDPKKEMMVKSKNTGVVVIDKKDFKKYEKQGYFAVEEVEVDEHKGKKKHKHPHLMTKDGELATVDEKKKEKEVVFKGTPAQIKKQMKDLRKKDKIKIGEDFIVTWKKKEVARHKTEQGARKLWHDLIDNPKKYGIKQDKIRLSQVGTTLKVVNEGLEVDLDETRGMTAHVIVMRHKDNRNLSVSVVANTKNVNAKKKAGFKVDVAHLAPNGATARYAKEIDKIIRDGDKNPKTGGYVKEDLDEKFDRKKFDDNEDKNFHTENGIALVNMFGDAYEKRQIAQIKKDHDKRGSITSKDQKVRDALVKKYLPKLKEDLDEAKGVVQPTKDGKGVFKVLPRDTKGMSGKQDPFSMGVYDKSGKKLIKDWGSHPSLEGAKKFARNHGIIEGVELDEGKMKELHMYIQQKKKPEWIAKTMGLDVKTVKSLMGEETMLEKVTKFLESARSDAKRAMSRDKDLGKYKDSADDDSYASDDDVKAASKNIIAQMRKVVSLRGNFKVEFQDGKKEKIDPKIAQSIQQKYNSMRKPADKEKFQAKIAKSKRDLLSALKESFGEAKDDQAPDQAKKVQAKQEKEKEKQTKQKQTDAIKDRQTSVADAQKAKQEAERDKVSKTRDKAKEKANTDVAQAAKKKEMDTAKSSDKATTATQNAAAQKEKEAEKRAADTEKKAQATKKAEKSKEVAVKITASYNPILSRIEKKIQERKNG